MTKSYAPQLDKYEKLTVDELRDLQFKRLKKSIAHAYENSVPYKDKFNTLVYTLTI